MFTNSREQDTIRRGSSEIYQDPDKAFSRYLQFFRKLPRKPMAWRGLAIRLEVAGLNYSAGVCRDMYFHLLRDGR